MTARIASADPTSWDTFDLKPFLPESGEGLALDLGCGPGIRREIEKLGYRYHGLDVVKTAGATIIASAESLPLASNQFSLIIGASSVEHFPDPWSAFREISRVLKSGGIFVASLSFLEPYHARSHFHMSHLGVYKLCESSGLVVERVEPFEWTGPEATAQALFQFAPARWVVGAIVKTALFVRSTIIKMLIKYYLRDQKRERAIEFLEEERFRFTAGIKFRARKP